MSGPGIAQGRPTFRFAPSPTGELHIGHALSALTGWHWAKQLGGRFLLRIEDIDAGRLRERFVDQICDDLAWLGVTWDEPVVRQSERLDAYCRHASILEEMGLLYPCFATRSDIADFVAGIVNHPTDPDGAPVYPGLHKDLPAREVARRQAAGDAFALRLDMERALAKASEMTGGTAMTYTALDTQGGVREVVTDPERWGDAVIVRKDVPTSYHLAVVCDDAEEGVSHVTRGRDLEAATDLHRLLQVLLGLPAPVYHHHRLIVDGQGAKLSKSLGAISLRALRADGKTQADVLAMVGKIEVPEV